MIQFLRRFCLFILPVILFIVGVEIYLGQYPSTFQKKATYFETHKDSISTLILGSSHNQAAFHLEYFEELTAVNLAFGNQSLMLDSLLLVKLLDELPELKVVVFELAYHTLELETSTEYHRNNLYLRYYGVNPFGRKVKLSDYSIFFSNPTFYVDYLNPFKKELKTNEFGYLLENPDPLTSNYSFLQLDYDSTKILMDTSNLIIQRHRYEDVRAYNRNVITFEGMIGYCSDKGMIPVIVSPPIYRNYYSMMIPEKEQRRLDFIQSLKEQYPSLIVFDENLKPTDYSVKWFRNEDHLNEVGAKKYSKFIEKKLINLLIEY